MAKRKGRHPSNHLTATAIRALKKPGMHADGLGLYLLVDTSGSKRWVQRIVAQGKRQELGFGAYPDVSLAEAREKALHFRKIAKAGGNPKLEKRKASQVIPTFAEAARTVHEEHKEGWRNEKHAAQWISTLEEYATPLLGEVKVDRIETPQVLQVLSPIWLTKPETARRVRQRIGTVLDWAKASGFRSGDNPVEGVAGGLPKQPKVRGNHAALPYKDVPAFIQRLRSEVPEPTALAFEFLILTAARTGEVIGARLTEIKGAVWTVPAERMKAQREHRVPLPPRAVDIVARAKELAGTSPYLFPGRSPKRPMSNMVFLMTMRRMEEAATPHGFRSSFRDWASEQTGFPRDVCEMALAHAIKDKTEAAYRRGDLFEKRRSLMEAWASYSTDIRALPVEPKGA